MIGQTFLPDASALIQKKLNEDATGPLSQEALQVLSLRLPEVLSGQPMAAADLMKPRIGGAQGGLEELLRLLAGVLQGGGGAPGQAPSPIFKPTTPTPTAPAFGQAPEPTPTTAPAPSAPLLPGGGPRGGRRFPF